MTDLMLGKTSGDASTQTFKALSNKSRIPFDGKELMYSNGSITGCSVRSLVSDGHDLGNIDS